MTIIFYNTYKIFLQKTAKVENNNLFHYFDLAIGIERKLTMEHPFTASSGFWQVWYCSKIFYMRIKKYIRTILLNPIVSEVIAMKNNNNKRIRKYLVAFYELGVIKFKLRIQYDEIGFSVKQ